MQGENPVHWLPPGPQSDSAVELPAWYLGCQSRRAARQEGDHGLAGNVTVDCPLPAPR